MVLIFSKALDSPLLELICLRFISLFFYAEFCPADYGLSCFAKFWNMVSFWGIWRCFKLGVVDVYPALPFVKVLWLRASYYCLEASLIILIWLYAVALSFPMRGGFGAVELILLFISSMAFVRAGFGGLWLGALSASCGCLLGESLSCDMSRHMTCDFSSRNYDASSRIISTQKHMIRSEGASVTWKIEIELSH